jgi:WD40 repeat protein
VKEERVRRLLLSAPVPAEVETLRRNWPVVREAFRQEERPTPGRRYARALVPLAAALAILAAAVSPPGQALGSWIRETVRERVAGQTPARPALASLPSPGRLLVTAPSGAWIVHADGSKRRLGAYESATWSPRGRFLAATRGRQLVALEPDGDVRWSLSRSRPIATPRWSPSGFRIAYFAGRSLRVVAGDGSPDRALAPLPSPVAPAWRPGDAHVLAFVDRRGAIRVVNTDTGRELWRTARGTTPTQLEWSSDGRRLLVATATRLRVYRDDGRLWRRVVLPRGARASSAAFAPGGHQIAYGVVGAADRASVHLFNPRNGTSRVVFHGVGSFSDVEWSPDGRWLLVAWPDADQFLFIRAPGVRKIVAVSNIARQFDPGRPSRAEFPEVIRWCCPE